jgi:hypothetical protein
MGDVDPSSSPRMFFFLEKSKKGIWKHITFVVVVCSFFVRLFRSMIVQPLLYTERHNGRWQQEYQAYWIDHPICSDGFAFEFWIMKLRRHACDDGMMHDVY